MRQLTTEHYNIHTDLDWRLAEDLGVRMEAMFSEYRHRLTEFNPPRKDRFEVYIFSRRQDYLKVTEDALPNTGGMFVPRRNLLAAFLESQGRDALRRTLQHEAFHQFAHTAIGPGLPIWLNEGIAQLFEEGVWTGRGFELDHVPPRRIRQMQQDLRDRRMMPFKEFLALTDEQWKQSLRDPATGAARYGQAWAMTRFLVFAPDEAGQPRYRSRLITLLKLIHSGEKADIAFVRAFSDNYEGFQQRFLEYVRTLQPTKEAVFTERQSILADMLIQLGAQGIRFDDVEAFRTAVTDNAYRLRYAKGAVQWSTESDPSLYFRDEKGSSMGSGQLYFSSRPGAPFPDIVAFPIQGVKFRTIFHEAKPRPDHETVIEAK